LILDDNARPRVMKLSLSTFKFLIKEIKLPYT
jgi:hypothetical protein